jgi:hypothetical protein
LPGAAQQAELLRAGKLAQADIEHIAEEIDSMGRTEKRRPSWEASVRVQRSRIADHLDDNPSLRPLLPQALASAYRDAALEAVAEMGLAGSTFPNACPCTVEQVLDGGFWPG